MGVRIKATGISREDDSYSIVDHSGRAARRSLERAGVRPDQVGVLINAGVFRDNNTVEPAISALIQKEAGIGLDYGFGDPRSFSFDLMNGAVGVLNAVQVAQSILETASAEHVVIVSGDTHPSLTRSAADEQFPYATSGAALLLEYTDAPEGFGRVHTFTGEGSPTEEAFVDTATMGAAGRTLMTVERDADFTQRLLDVAAGVARAALEEVGEIDPETTILIASTPTTEFPRLLADTLGIAEVRTPDLSAGDPHTASLPLAYDRAVAEESLRGFSRILFVAAGAGPSAAAVLYRLPELAGARA
ncbi:hypothetical protein [Nocardia terpenica]|uniref:Beta-ketoacyl-[acyl-carrier-protein] synthase III N-terminal domain-containing protein n=1 Tax=Nocardia terpenica TaxID=455432 RepID=A0A164J5L8_9NOCA|nr:hypothetical protein [Nocardia terpenica]KZM70071.1 hypothetical protein AWN90_05690 [Nocardia terpenica]NQE91471.1 hypothetical protein [Nocardia terpenica]